MSSDKNVAKAVGAKTARVCDSCMDKRARWYCTADDAFLCQACDVSVHSANPLARRHERVRLKIASLKPTEPAWHQGFHRKARTPRNVKPAMLKAPKVEELTLNPLPLVPEIGSDEASPDENEEQLLYRVPIFNPCLAEFCTSATPNEVETTNYDSETIGSDSKTLLPDIPGFLPSDMDLLEFAADVDTLLGRGLDDEDSFGMEGLGLLDSREEYSGRVVKVEEEEKEMESVLSFHHVDPEIDMSRETLDLNFDYNSPASEEEEDEKVVVRAAMMLNSGYKDNMTRGISLRLNYNAVIDAWASQGSPWMTGDRQQFNPYDCWPDCSGTYPTVHHSCEDLGGVGGHMAICDEGREARVSRYREKRRTRLFSKKIRYEVRKLNAEKRPRMKGRFVKRASLAGPSFPF